MAAMLPSGAAAAPAAEWRTKLRVDGLAAAAGGPLAVACSALDGDAWTGELVLLDRTSLAPLATHALPCGAAAVAAVCDVTTVAGKDFAAPAFTTVASNDTKTFAFAFVVARDDCDVSVHDLTGAEIARYEGHDAPVRAVATHSDGAMASADAAGVVRVWRTDTDAYGIYDYTNHRGAVGGLAWLSDGMLASGGADGRVVVRQLTGGPTVCADFGAAVTSLAGTQDWLLVGLADGRVVGWDLRADTRKEVIAFPPGAGVGALAAGPEGVFVAGADDGSALVHSLARRSSVSLRHDDYVRGVAWLDGQTIATGGWDGVVRTWTGLS